MILFYHINLGCKRYVLCKKKIDADLIINDENTY
nr:MAG TPA: hypothetical protein [Caudoviricetes sp.]